MAGGKKSRKAYKFKRVSMLGGLIVIGRKLSQPKPMPAERQANVVIAYHTAIDAFTGGYAEKTHYDTIVYALNIGGILAQNGIGAEYIDMIPPASAAMVRCKERWLETGKFGLDGDGLQAIKNVADLHQAQIEVATQGELEAAINEMHRRLGTKFKLREAA